MKEFMTMEKYTSSGKTGIQFIEISEEQWNQIDEMMEPVYDRIAKDRQTAIVESAKVILNT